MSIFRQRWMCGVTSSGTGTLTDVLYVRSLLVRRYDGLDIILSPEKWVGSRRACANKWPTEKSRLYIQFLCNLSAMQTPSAVRPAFSRMECMSLAIQCILMDSNTVDFRSGQRPPARYHNSPMTQSRIRNFCDRVLAENWGSEKPNYYVRYFLEYQQNQINISGWTQLHTAIDPSLGHSSFTMNPQDRYGSSVKSPYWHTETHTSPQGSRAEYPNPQHFDLSGMSLFFTKCLVPYHTRCSGVYCWQILWWSKFRSVPLHSQLQAVPIWSETLPLRSI
jgi:hypothetical protein